MKINGDELGDEASKRIAELLKENPEASPEKKKFIKQCIEQKRAAQKEKETRVLLYRFRINDESPSFEVRYGRNPGNGWVELEPGEELWDIFTRLSAQYNIPMESWSSSRGVKSTETEDYDN